MFWTYVIESETSGKFYIGHTNNLEDRIFRHNAGQNIYTRNKGPWRLVFSQHFPTRAQAVRSEAKLKSFKNKSRTLSWIHKNISPVG